MKKSIVLIVAASICFLFGNQMAKAETYNLTQDSFNSGFQTQDGALVVAKLPKKKTKVDILESQTASPLPTDSGFFWNVYGGYDYAVIGSIGDNFKTFYDLVSPGANSSSYGNDHSGILAGTEFGLTLDKDNSLSLSLENVWTSKQFIAFKSGGENLKQSVTPSLLGISMNYSRMIVHNAGSKMSFAIGLGYYHAGAHFRDDENGDDLIGNFGGDILGGTLGINEELSLGGGLSLEFMARGRVANFSQLTGNNLADNGTPITSGPFSLLNEPVGPFSIIVPIPTSVALPPGLHYTQLDYSGFDGNITLKLAI